MTTISCLLAWLFLYLFAVSSLSLCSINGNVGEDAQDGLAIGQSEQNHANEDPDVIQQQTMVQDGENAQLTPQEPSTVSQRLEENNMDGDSLKDAVRERNNGELEIDEGIEGSTLDADIERERDPSLPDGEPSHDNDPTPVNSDLPDAERSSQAELNQHATCTSGDDEGNSKVSMEDLHHQTDANIVKDEDEAGEENNQSGNIGLTPDEVYNSERSSSMEDPSLKQTPTPEEEAIDSVNNSVQYEKLDDIKTDNLNKQTEGKKTNTSVDGSEPQSGVEKMVYGNETVREDEKKGIPTEQVIKYNIGEKDEAKRKKDEEENGKGLSPLIDQQIDKTEEEMGDIKGKGKGGKEKETKEEKDEKEKETKEEKDEKEKETKEEKDEKTEIHEGEKEGDESKPVVESDKEETKLNVTDGDVIKTEEMPSYDEWREKKLQQAQEDFDRELGQGERNPVPAPKFNLNENSKNHASADCGAKILGTNPEAQSASAILNSNRDIYMINPCSAKSIWFVVELCEPIQVKLIELANYELFSCVPESFKVSISDRYPVREWHLLGTFVARDERSLQNFPLNEETMFAKYMKIEMLTFFGSEHFCPLSVLRVFGTSMVEEIDDAEGVNSGSAREQDVLPVHPTPLAEDLKGNGILDHAKDAVFKLVEKAAKVLTGSKSDTDAYTDNMTEGATEEILMEGSLPDDITKDENHQGPDSEYFNDKCNGQEVCFQENYSTISQHCCLSLFAQTAGSILICCKALRRGPKPIKSDEETGKEKTKLPLPIQLPIEVIQTKMEKTQATIEGSIQTSLVLEPTPPESYYGEDERIETSSPPLLILSTKTLIEATHPSETPQSDILATRTSAEEVLRTPIEQTQNAGDDVTGGIDSSGMDGKESESYISVAPIPPPPTVSSIEEENTKETSGIRDSHDVETSTATEPTKTRDIKDDAATPVQTQKLPEMEEKVQPADNVSEKDATKVNAAKGDVSSSSKKLLEAEINGNVSEQLKDKVPKTTGDAKEQNGANKNISNKMQEPKQEMNESPKVSPSSTLGEKSTSMTENSKSATVEVGNGSFSPSASSLSGLGPLPHGTQKESVLMRLNNRIKTLEINMSLSGLYLEELSQRYRKQMDEMQKAFNTKIKSVQENAQKAQEVKQQQAEYIQQLEKKLDKMTTDLENVTLRMDGILREVVERHLFLMLCEVVVMLILFSYCLRRSTSRSTHNINTSVGMATKSGGKKPVEDVGRRNSDGLLHVPLRDKISLSPGLGTRFGFMKDGVNSKTGSLDDLLIIGPTTPLREALRQASEPSKQKNRNKNKGRHKNPQRPASAASNENVYQGAVSSSSSNSSVASTFSLPSTSSTKGLPGATSSKHSTAGLLFRGSAEIKKGSQGGQGKQGTVGKGGNQPPQRGGPENLGQVNGVYQGNKNNGIGVNGYNEAGSRGGGKKNNQCFNGYGKR